MTSNGRLVDGFRSADDSGLPALGDLDERLRAFWVLRVGQQALGVDVMTPTEISTVLRDVYSVLVSRQRIEAILSAEKDTVAKRRKDGRRGYQLMAAGSGELDTAGNTVMFIEPNRALSAVRETHSLLGGLRGDLRICDPYADARTLDMLAECTSASSVRFLTHNVKKAAGFKHGVKAFAKEQGIDLVARVAPAGVLHDRYIIHERGMLTFGTSLNGLGLKQSFVVALGDDIRTTVLAAFEATWESSSPL